MAAIAPTIYNSEDDDRVITWETLTEADTATPAFWPGGEGFVQVKGTFGSGTVVMQFSDVAADMYAVNATAAPDGASFTAAGIVKFDLPTGYVGVSASGGTGQDVDIKISPKINV